MAKSKAALASAAARRAKAIALIQPSRYEGWSTTIEEAISCGTPIIASDISSNSEQLINCNDATLVGLNADHDLIEALLSPPSRLSKFEIDIRNDLRWKPPLSESPWCQYTTYTISWLCCQCPRRPVASAAHTRARTHTYTILLTCVRARTPQYCRLCVHARTRMPHSCRVRVRVVARAHTHCDTFALWPTRKRTHPRARVRWSVDSGAAGDGGGAAQAGGKGGHGDRHGDAPCARPQLPAPANVRS